MYTNFLFLPKPVNSHVKQAVQPTFVTTEMLPEYQTRISHCKKLGFSKFFFTYFFGQRIFNLIEVFIH